MAYGASEQTDDAPEQKVKGEVVVCKACVFGFYFYTVYNTLKFMS